MNLSELKELFVPQGEVYEIFNSMTGQLLWKKDRKFTVVFDPNGGTGTMTSQEFTVGELQAIQSNTFTKSGNSFYGWSLTPNGSPQYSNGQQVTGIGTCEGTITLYAVWAMSLNSKYTFTSNSTFVVPMTGVYSIELHGGGGGGGGAAVYSDTGGDPSATGGAGGGSGAKYTTTLTKGDSYALTIGAGGAGGAAGTGRTNRDAQGKSGSDGGTTKFGSLYSCVGGTGGSGGYASGDYGGTEKNGSTGTAKGNLASGSSGGASTGTYGNGGTGGTVQHNGLNSYPFDGKAGKSGAVFVTLIEYAPYTVNFNANGGSGSMASQTFNVDESQVLTTNAFTYSGYDFAGWSTSPTGNVMYSNGESVTNIGNSGETVTLYAIWTIPVGTKYTYTSNTTFVVPATGTYTIELHGGGGGGGGGAAARLKNSGSYFDKNSGGSGGGSGAKYTTILTKDDSYALTIGVGGSAGSNETAKNSTGSATCTGSTGGTGGTTKFGSLYSVAGGAGGTGGSADARGTSGRSGSTGTAKGNLASGSSGGSSVGTYGNGGTGGTCTNTWFDERDATWSGASKGQSGAVIITFVG